MSHRPGKKHVRQACWRPLTSRTYLLPPFTQPFLLWFWRLLNFMRPSDLGNISCKFIDRTFSSQSNFLSTEFWHQNSARGPFLEFLFLSTDKPTSRNLLMLIVALASREGGCRLSRNWATGHVGGLVERANVAFAICRKKVDGKSDNIIVILVCLLKQCSIEAT